MGSILPDEAGRDGAIRLLLVLVRERRALLLYPLVVTVVVVLVSFLFSNQYKSTVVILPPERDFQSSDLMVTDFGMFAGGGLALPVMATPSDILRAVITSRTVRDSLLSYLDLRTRWGKDKASGRLRERSGAEVTPTGIIEAWVVDTDRYFCDTLVNALVEQADRVNRMIVNTKARRTREFVEARLAETRIELENAEADLERFQNEHRTVALDAQISALVQNAAQLQAQITADEIELSVLEGSLSPEHHRIRSLKSRIRETRRRLDALQSSAAGDTTAVVLEAGLKDLPKLVQQLAEITRNLKIAENLFTLLTEQHENARIQEQRDTPSFSVLDRARGGGAKVRPRRALIGMTTLIVSFCLALVIVILRSYLSELPARDPAKHRMLAEIRAAFGQSRRKARNSGKQT